MKAKTTKAKNKPAVTPVARVEPVVHTEPWFEVVSGHTRVRITRESWLEPAPRAGPMDRIRYRAAITFTRLGGDTDIAYYERDDGQPDIESVYLKTISMLLGKLEVRTYPSDEIRGWVDDLIAEDGGMFHSHQREAIKNSFRRRFR